MNQLPRGIDKYLRTRTLPGPWHIEGSARGDFFGAVVIPALAESQHLPATLAGIAATPRQELERFLVLVVVNQRADADPADQADNLAVLEQLRGGDLDLPGLQLGWVDAASCGFELPAAGGVGTARKIGFDLALGRLDFRGQAPILASLDADTLVEPGYLGALSSHFASAPQGGAAIPFRHRDPRCPRQREAIERYELYLRHYVLGLQLAGSPYAYHTVGSALACRAEAYAAAGGMNRRAAGEDFYFLQQLAKTCGVAPLAGTLVHPSPRPSRRVPFGTGPSVAKQLEGEPDAVRFYHPACFTLLKSWLGLVEEHCQSGGPRILELAGELSPELGSFLQGADFLCVWDRLARNHRDREALIRAFHGWFDGLRTLRLIHHLSAGPLPRCSPLEALPALLSQAGLPPQGATASMLECLRTQQGAAVQQDNGIFCARILEGIRPLQETPCPTSVSKNLKNPKPTPANTCARR